MLHILNITTDQSNLHNYIYIGMQDERNVSI